ncbi:low molecular weight phosphatase family protein [Halocola ammonii]
MKTLSLYPALEAFFEKIKTEKPTERHRAERERIASYIASEVSAGRTVKLIFICTHNSRRSQLAEFWTSALAFRLDLPLLAFSGGTSVTALFPAVAESLKRSGVTVKKESGDNPLYRFSFADGTNSSKQFSKFIDDRQNPQDQFVAVMLCSDAEQNCPIVKGADERFSLPFEDPKTSDGTEQERKTYAVTSLAIAAEIYEFLNSAKTKLKND